MILIDTNIFLIDRFLLRDSHYNINKEFVSKLTILDAAITIFNMYELAGAASFNLSGNELRQWLYNFNRVYRVKIIFPINLNKTTKEFFKNFTTNLFKLMEEKKVHFLDGAILILAEQHKVEKIVTWNKKHFDQKTMIPVYTPAEFLNLAK